MKPCLADVNILLALLVRHHERHEIATKWFERLPAGAVGLCRQVQLALISLLGNRSIMGDYAMSAAAALGLIAELLEDERVEFVAEPPQLDSVLTTLLKEPAPTPKLIGDVYLAAFAIAGSRTLVTPDLALMK